jgi:uncharacterized membrane protein
VWLGVLLVAPLGSDLPYLFGSFICHQRPERSFWIAGRPMPVCARCTGLYAAASAGGLLALAQAALTVPRMRASRIRWTLLAAAIPTIATLVVEWLGIVQPSSLVRALAASPLGFAGGWVVTTAVRSVS